MENSRAIPSEDGMHEQFVILEHLLRMFELPRTPNRTKKQIIVKINNIIASYPEIVDYVDHITHSPTLLWTALVQVGNIDTVEFLLDRGARQLQSWNAVRDPTTGKYIGLTLVDHTKNLLLFVLELFVTSSGHQFSLEKKERVIRKVLSVLTREEKQNIRTEDGKTPAMLAILTGLPDYLVKEIKDATESVDKKPGIHGIMPPPIDQTIYGYTSNHYKTLRNLQQQRQPPGSTRGGNRKTNKSRRYRRRSKTRKMRR